MPEEPRPFAMIPMKHLSEMLNPNSDKMMRLLDKHIPREMLTADRAQEVFNALKREAEIRERDQVYFPLPDEHPLTQQSMFRNETKFSPKFQDIMTGEPMDIAFQLLKEDSLDPEEKTPIKDEMVNYKFPSAGPYWAMNDRQKRIADAVMDLPSEYLSEEGGSGYDFDHLFAEGHETVPDQEYDRLEAALRYFKSYIKDHMARPNSDKSPKFLESWDDPRHPWAMARNMAFYRETEPYDHFSEDFKEANKSEPMDIAMRLLKMPIIDTDIPGVRMGYNEKWIHPHNYPEPTIGTQPYFTDFDNEGISGG